ncbi:Metal binding domain of Ada [Lachnospiraceae bacterium YSD2013]|nr:Metal binding domain of Ada [Lachnospiraceae bacterium YSD2013]
MIKNVIKWAFAASFALMSLVCILMGTKVSALLWLIIAFGVSPLFSELMSRLNIHIRLKTYAIGLISCILVATFAIGIEYSESEDETIPKSVETVSVEERVIDSDVPAVEEVADEVEKDEILLEEESLELNVHFIDVGQGDCTLLESKGKYMLIDAGPDNVGTKIQKYLSDVGVTKLDYFILTHPDSDHIGSADVVATKFDIDTIYMSSFIKDNKYYHDMLDAFAYKNLKWSIPEEDTAFELGDATVTILHTKEYDDPNNSSLCVKVTCGDTAFLFAGDAEATAEKDMIAQNKDLSATVYHVSHHGSYTSSTKEFLDLINPKYAVVSCAKDNEYGHPHQETLDTLREKNVALFRTDLQGGITAFSDGKEIQWSTIPEKEYKGGDSALEKKAKSQEFYTLDNETQGDSTNVTKSVPSDNTDNTKASESTGKQESKSSNGGSSNSNGGNGGSNLKGFQNDPVPSEAVYIGNKNNMKLHCADCKGNLPKEKNRVYFNSLEEAEAAGYTKEKQCHNCYPYGK